MTPADIDRIIDAEYALAREKYRRSGDSYHEGYLDGLERAGVIIARALRPEECV